ncbi:MAG: hypothetical protein OEL20_04545 [Sulfuritalea sp.]|nr:hypothetical protein [Sulfuritalea sp.]
MDIPKNRKTAAAFFHGIKTENRQSGRRGSTIVFPVVHRSTHLVSHQKRMPASSASNVQQVSPEHSATPFNRLQRDLMGHSPDVTAKRSTAQQQHSRLNRGFIGVAEIRG